MSNVMQNQVVASDEEEGFISWSSILAGVLIVFIVSLFFNLLGTGIGFSIFSPKMVVLKPLGIATIIWLILTAIISMYTGGWVATYFSQVVLKTSGIIYGLLVSGISAFISLVIMTTTAGFVIGGSLNALGTAISASNTILTKSGSALQKVLQDFTVSPELVDEVKKTTESLEPVIKNINREVFNLVSKAENTRDENNTRSDNGKGKSKIEELVWNYLNADKAEDKEAIENNLVDELSRLTGKSSDDLKKTIDIWQKKYQEAKEKAYEATVALTKKIAKLISGIALMNFIILLIGVISAIIGAVNGIKKEYVGVSLNAKI